jgi:DNA recombination protein RmuC
MIVVSILLALIVGALSGYIFTSTKSKVERASNEVLLKSLEEQKIAVEKDLSVTQELLKVKQLEVKTTESALQSQTKQTNDTALELVAAKTTNENLKEKLDIQKKEIEALQQRLTTEFENIANKLLKERSQEFATSNVKQLSEIINPLKERIKDFEKKVDETYDRELRDKANLREELRMLTTLNTKVSEEANNLAKALKGDVKKQGNWGEVVLERVLERSGLTKGQEYLREEVVEGADQNRQRPDVIVHLPDKKHIIIDSKVSLVAYERFMSTEDEDQKNIFLKDHINSLRNHVKFLSERNYQNAININTPDFVLMFVPIEASFSAAVQTDGELFSYAWERKIVIVSPTTLLATLRTISSIWKQENQTKNAQEIARLSGTMYDKFVGFLEDMNKIKSSIDRASTGYDEAVKKLKDGKGNLISTAEKIKELGAKSGNVKSIPPEFDNQ